MEIKDDISLTLMEIDAQRISRGMSYQAVADACGVSKSTIYRVLNGTTEPTVQLVQNIAASVQYKPREAEIIPVDYTQDAYITYLKETILRQREEKDRQIRQLQAHYNMLRCQDRRVIAIMGVTLGILVLFICGLFLYDFAHLDRGWIQTHFLGQFQRFTSNAFSPFGGCKWIV